MSWTVARLGSRFSLFFDPHRRRVLHSALGRFLDQPLDLMIGLVEPDGTERVLPFTARGSTLYNSEQFERINSITFRGFSEKYRLRFEFNVHSVFYPQDEKLCLMPAFYLEMRVNPMPRVRWIKPKGPTPERVKLFIRLGREETQITTSTGGNGDTWIDMAYDNGLVPRLDGEHVPLVAPPDPHRRVAVKERIVSLNAGAVPDADGRGLSYEIPVTESGSGTKWRLVWGAHVGDRVLDVGDTGARLRATRHWKSIDHVMQDAVAERDTRLAQSRRFEKLFDQAPLYAAQRHLINHSFQAFLSNTYWCELDNGSEWFSVLEGSSFYHATVDVEYNISLFYLALWPRLLALELNQWPGFGKPHKPSGGTILSHDIGIGARVGTPAYPHDMPVEENSNYLLMLHAYAHWTGDVSLLRTHADFIEHLAKYLIWTDRDASGFPTEGTANTVDDASPAAQYARKQTYLAIKRVAALQAAADLLARVDRNTLAQQCGRLAERDAAKIEQEAWLGDHYAVCVDRSAAGVVDPVTGKPLPFETIPGWDAYSIYTANGLLLPALTGQPCPIDTARLRLDMKNTVREAMGHYGCGHTSFEPENVWVSQNLWRDHLARHLGAKVPMLAQLYWDMQVMSNTDGQAGGYTDTYINNYLSHYPRGITSLGAFLAEPRLTIDRLAPGGARISVEPDTHMPQRWPLLPLADWKANKIPVCVVDAQGRVTIEGECDPVDVRCDEETSGIIG